MALPNSVSNVESWVGIVDEYSGGKILALCQDAYEQELDVEIGFDLEEIPPEQRRLIEVGTVFHWHVDQITGTDGLTTTETSFCFPPEKPWTAAEIEEAKQIGEEALQAFRS